MFDLLNKFDYSFYIKCTASYEFKQNFLIQSDNLFGNFDLTQQKEGSIIFNAVTSICLLISVIATIFSGYEYLKDGKELLKD